MTIYNIQQDSKGYIWMGTAAGICRYDGKEFEYFRHPEQVDDEIIHLIIDKADQVWYSNLVGQVFGIKNAEEIFELKFNDNYSFLHFYAIDSLVVLNLGNREKENYPLFASKINNPEINNFNSWQKIADTKNRTALLNFSTTGNRIFIDSPSDKKLLHLHVLKERNYDIKNLKEIFEPKPSKIILAKQQNSVPFAKVLDDVVWFRNYEKITFFDLRKNQKIKTIQLPETINFLHLKGKEVWVGVKEEGLKIFDSKFNEKHTYFSGITFNSTFDDYEGNTWLATNDKGIFIIPSVNYSLYTPSNSRLPFDKVNFLLPNDDKSIIAGGNSGKIISISEGKIDLIHNSKNIAQFSFGAKTGENKWIFSKGDNLIVLDPLGIHRQKLPSVALKTIELDNQKNIWFGSYPSAIKIPLGEIRKVNADYFRFENSSRMLVKRTYAVRQDYKNDVWLGTSSGLYKYLAAENKTIPFNPESDELSYRYTTILQSAFDSSIWAATHGNGLLKIKNDEVVARFTENDFLSSNICNDIFEDAYKNLWIAGNKGIQKYNLQTEEFELIDKHDGLPTNEVVNIAVVDSTVYAGTKKGLVTFSIDAENKNAVAPPIYITGVSIVEKDTLVLDDYELDYDQNSIQINFLGIAFKCRGDVLYKYRMLGIDSAWVKTNTRFVRFPALAPSNYEFQVLAMNEDGVESLQPEILKFKISPPFWKTWWFQISSLLGGILTIGLFYSTRYRRIQRREKMKQDFKDQVNDLRSQALQTQMNPHFIFNSLNAIQHFLTTNDQENAMIYLARFAKLIRHIFEQSKKKVITLTQELDFLKLYVSLEKLRFKDKVSIRFEVDEESHFIAEDIEFPPLLIQPIIENAFKHGLFHKVSPGNLLIKFSFEKGILTCLIEDDGIGRTRSQEINQWKKGDHKSSGLKSTQERIQLLNEENSSNTDNPNNLKITDLFTPEGIPSGTRVEISLKPKNL